MGIDSTMAILYAQTGLAAPLVNTTAVAPQAQIAVSRVIATEMMRQEQHKIAKAEKVEQAFVRPDDQGKGNPTRFGSRRRKLADSESEEAPLSSPFVGNLLNLKV